MLARWALRRRADTLLEPSFGGCTILEAALERLHSLGCADPVKQIFGFDVDDSAFLHLGRLLRTSSSTQFRLCDFLQVEPGRLSVDAIIANPPFVSYHGMTSNQRATVRSWRARYQPAFPMTASLWGYFLAHSLAFLRPSGRLAFVLPFAARSANYAQPLMTTMARCFTRVSIYRVSEQLFIQAGAGERTIVLLADGYLGSHPPAGHSVDKSERSVATLHDLDQLLRNNRLNSHALTPRPPITSDRANHPAVQAALDAGRLCKLGDYASATIGEVVGDTAYFVKTIDQWNELGISRRQLRPLITRTAQLQGLRVTKGEVRSLYGGIPFLLSPPARRLTKAVARYLNKYPRAERRKNKTFAKRDPWHAVGYDPTANAFIGSLSHESPRIVLNTAGISCANGLYKLKANKGTPWPTWLPAAALTTVFRHSAETLARVRGAGALKLEPSDVSNLVVPSAPPLNAARLQALLRRLDALLRVGELESATREADQALLVDTRLLAKAELSSIRNAFQDLRGERLPSKR
jgi:adenine-specific DNA-methyltransferase